MIDSWNFFQTLKSENLYENVFEIFFSDFQILKFKQNCVWIFLEYFLQCKQLKIVHDILKEKKKTRLNSWI